MLHSMTIGLVLVHQLETRYLCYGVKFQPGVIWGHRGQILIFTKNAYSCNSYICISLRPSYLFGGQKSIWGHLGS